MFFGGSFLALFQFWNYHYFFVFERISSLYRYYMLYKFFIFSVLSNSISLGMYHVFWHLLTLRCWICVTVLPFIWFWGKFDVFHLEVIIVRWSWSWLLELHIQVSHSSHCGIHHWWEMLRLLYRIQYPWNLWKHWNLCFSCSQGKHHGTHIAARRAKHMRGAYEIDDFMELRFLVFGSLCLKQILLYGGLRAKLRGKRYT